MSWLDKLFSKQKPVFAPAAGADQAAKAAGLPTPEQAAPIRKATALSNDAKAKIADLVDKATACWGSGRPAVTATWLGRTAVISAESGDQRKAIELLERARGVLGDTRDPISADRGLVDVAVCFAKAGSALADSQLFERGLGLVSEVHGIGFRGLGLASIFGYLSETGDTSRARSVKKQLMSQMEFLSGFEYCITVGGVVKILAKSSAGKDEVVSLLKTGLTRAGSDKHFGATAVRDIGIAYAKAARDLAEKELIESALDIVKQLEGAAERASVYQDCAIAYAVLGLEDLAKRHLGKEKKEMESIEDSRDRGYAEIDYLVANVLVGVISGGVTLAEEGLKSAEGSEDRDLALMRIVEALVDVAKSKNDPGMVAKAGEIADRLEEPFDRDCRLADRVGVLWRSGRCEDAETLITRGRSDAESISDSISRGSAYLSIAEAVLRTA